MISLIEKNIRKFFSSRMQGLGSEIRNVVAINQFNSFDISNESATKELSAKGYEGYIYYHQFSDEGIVGPYEPFLKFVRESVRELDIDIEDFYNNCQVINMQRPLFDSILSSDIFNRVEYVIYNEVDYERCCFENSLIAMIDYITMIRPTMFIFNRIHMAGGTTIKLLNDMIIDSVPEIAMFFSFDNTYKIPGYMKNVWSDLITTLTEYELIIEWTGGDKIESTVQTFGTSIDNLPEYYKQINNLKMLFAYNQAYYYLKKVDKILNRNKSKVDIDLKYKLYGVFSIVAIFKGKIANAILYCNEINLLKNDLNCSNEMVDRIDFYYYYLLGYAQMYNEQENDARASALKAIEVAKKIGQEERVFAAELIEHMSRFAGWKDNVWIGDIDEQRDYKLIKKAEQFGFINHLAHIYVYAFDNNAELYNDYRNLEMRIYHWKKGMEIANELNNKKFAFEACRKAIMWASVSGYYDVSDYLYKTYFMPIVVESNNRFEEANIYNGLGFNKCMQGDYNKANNYFNKALDIFVDLRRYDYIGETLYNMAVNCISARDFENGDVYISASMKILKYLKTDMMRVCHTSKINGIKALCTLMTGNTYTAEGYIRKAGIYLNAIIDISIYDPFIKYWRDDVFIYNYVKMGIEYEYGNFDNMEQYMKRLQELATGAGTFKDLLLGAADIESFVKIYEQDKQRNRNKYRLTMDKYSIKEILDECKNATAKIECERLKNDIDFFAIWKMLIRKFNKNKYLLVENACIAIENNYNIDNCVVIEYTYGEPAILFNSGRYISIDSMKRIGNYFRNNPEEFFTSKYDRRFEYYKELVDIFDVRSIENFCGYPFFEGDDLSMVILTFTKIRNTWNKHENRISVDEGNSQFMNIMFRELIDAVYRVNDKLALENNALLEAYNEKLKRIANYDRLTGLYNRHGFYYAVEEYCNNNIKDLCVAFLDLDNFKYYNDHFGHDIGDVILQEVSYLLQDICSDNDTLVRYGGDEFLIIFNTNSCEEASMKVSRIYERIKSKEYFIDLIEELLCKEINIPERYKLSCSIGISKVVDDNISEGISEAITRADGALYYIKHTSKKQCVIWDEVKDKIN